MNEPIAIVTADHAGTIITWTGYATEWFGHTESEAIGRLVDELVPAEFRADHRGGLERAMSGGERHLEGAATYLPVLHANGMTVIHPARFNHITTAEGVLVAATAVFGPPNPEATPWQPIEIGD